MWEPCFNIMGTTNRLRVRIKVNMEILSQLLVAFLALFR